MTMQTGHVILRFSQQPGSRDYWNARRRYLSDPDPVAWLAAADVCLEAGERYANVAALWRKRGQWWSPLREALTTSQTDDWSQIILGGCSWTFSRKDAYVEVSLGNAGQVGCWRRFRILNLSSDDTYWTRRLLEMIDRVPDLTATKGEGEL